MSARNSNQKSTKQLVDAVVRAMEIMDCFSLQETEFSLNELCERTGMYKSRVHRLCGTLLATGYLVKTSRANYRLGPKVMVLGKAYEQTNSLRTIAAPFMKDLSNETGLSSALFVLDGMKCICMAREMGLTRLVYAMNEGEYMELTPTAAGGYCWLMLTRVLWKKCSNRLIIDNLPIRQSHRLHLSGMH